MNFDWLGIENHCIWTRSRLNVIFSSSPLSSPLFSFLRGTCFLISMEQVQASEENSLLTLLFLPLYLHLYLHIFWVFSFLFLIP